MNITEALPTTEAVLQLEPEELASYLLGHLAANTSQLHLNNFLTADLFTHYGRDQRVEQAFLEAWAWLLREGLLIPKDQHGWVLISRRGHRVQDRQDFDAFRRSNVLPKASLHPVIAERVWPIFVRGDYETAVFQAFKEVEIAVRAAGQFAFTDIGTDLMGKAFAPQRGPLADQTLPDAEQRAMMYLFVGAVGLFKPSPRSARKPYRGCRDDLLRKLPPSRRGHSIAAGSGLTTG